MKHKVLKAFFLTVLLFSFSFIFLEQGKSTGSVVKVGIIADIHYEPLTDGVNFVSENWTKEAIKEWEDWGANFAIQLGDCGSDRYLTFYRTPENSFNIHKYFYDNIWVSEKIPLYNVLGNHEIGVCKKADILSLWHLPSNSKLAYYSFDYANFHFLVLDNHDYQCANAQDASWAQYHFKIWDAQKTWLINDLKNSHKPTIGFIHVPISGKFYPNTTAVNKYYNRVENAPEIWDILESDGDVVAFFEGHYHNPASQCKDAYHWMEENGTVHYFGVPCLINLCTQRSRGFLTLDSINRQLVFDVINDNFTRHYEFKFDWDSKSIGDLNNDGFVNDIDLDMVASHWWYPRYYNAIADINMDGKVDDQDLDVLATNWWS